MGGGRPQNSHPRVTALAVPPPNLPWSGPLLVASLPPPAFASATGAPCSIQPPRTTSKHQLQRPYASITRLLRSLRAHPRHSENPRNARLSPHPLKPSPHRRLIRCTRAWRVTHDDFPTCPRRRELSRVEVKRRRREGYFVGRCRKLHRKRWIPALRRGIITERKSEILLFVATGRGGRVVEGTRLLI